MTESLSPATYDSLREEVGQILAEGKLHSRQATDWERLETYWNVGNAIYVRILKGPEGAEYGERVIARLAGDMQLGKVSLHEPVRFRRALRFFTRVKN